MSIRLLHCEICRNINGLACLLVFFRQLPNGDRQYIVLPETAHNPVFAKTRAMYWHVTRAFLTMADAQV